MKVSTAEMSNTVTVSPDTICSQEESKKSFASKLTRSNKWLCLPKQRATSTRTFKYFKIFLSVLFISMFIFEVTLNILCIKFYRDRVQDLRDSEIWPPRTRIQIESTNGHFFLFTTLMVGTAILIGILAIFMENLILLAGYAYVHGIVTGFEIIGAWQSFDQEVVIRKVIGVAPEPIMVILALIFAHMCRNNERSLAKSPMFKQLMAAKAGKGETMSDPNYKLSQESDDNNNASQDKQVSLEMERGYVNDALDLTDDADGNVRPLESPRSVSNEMRQSPEVQLNPSVTVLMDGKTRISVTGCESPSKPADLVIESPHREDTPDGDKVPCGEVRCNEEADESEKANEIEGNDKPSSTGEDVASELCPSPTMPMKIKGASVVGYEEKVTASKESNDEPNESNESRIL